MKIAIIDSGINAAHPHVRGIAGGIGVTNTEGWVEDTSDRLGHGTAIAAVIREKVPEAELFAVKIFHRGFFAQPGILVRAFDWCRHHRMDLVNLSIGFEDASQDVALEGAIDELLVVSPARRLPDCLAGVLPVEADETLTREEFRYRGGVFYASPFPRPEAGLACRGVDFAVANMTGLVGRTLPAVRGCRECASTTDLRQRLLTELAAIKQG